MKLAAIFIVWDDWELLEHSISNIWIHVETIIVVWSQYSNFGEYSPRPRNEVLNILVNKFVEFEPDLKNSPRDNETLKRNIGLDWARKSDCTHFLMLDADEFYTYEDIFKGRQSLKNTVCKVKTYFKSPTLTIGYDTTLVPFIHKLTPDLKFEWNRNYPFAWVDGQIRIDPTRQMNITSGVDMIDVTMNHYSWVRRDIKKKIRNSTARVNLERSTIVQDYLNAKEGYFCQFYKKSLEACSNLFDLPEMIDEKLSI